jgi:hypothetical protein
LEDEFHDLLKRITPSEKWLKNYQKILLEVVKDKNGAMKNNINSAKEKLAVLQTEKAKLIEMKKKDLLDDEDFKNEMEKVKNNINELQATACDQPVIDINIAKDTEKVFKVISGLAPFYRQAKYEAKLKLQSLIFTEKPVFDFSENRTPKISLILQTKRELAQASSPIVVPRGIEPLLPG